MTLSLALARAGGDAHLIGSALGNIAHAACALGDYARARALYKETLGMARDLGFRWGIAVCLEGLGRVALGEGRPGRAARLYGAAEALREEIGAPISADDRRAYAYEPTMAAIRAALGDDHRAALWTEGRGWPPEQAVMYALD